MTPRILIALLVFLLATPASSFDWRLALRKGLGFVVRSNVELEGVVTTELRRSSPTGDLEALLQSHHAYQVLEGEHDVVTRVIFPNERSKRAMKFARKGCRVHIFRGDVVQVEGERAVIARRFGGDKCALGALAGDVITHYRGWVAVAALRDRPNTIADYKSELGGDVDEVATELPDVIRAFVAFGADLDRDAILAALGGAGGFAGVPNERIEEEDVGGHRGAERVPLNAASFATRSEAPPAPACNLRPAEVHLGVALELARMDGLEIIEDRITRAADALTLCTGETP